MTEWIIILQQMKSLVIASLLSALSLAQTPAGCNGVLNTSPTLTLTPTPLKTVKNGQSWLMDDGAHNVLYIARLSGTPYQMGHALGELYGEQIAKNIENLVDYGYQMLMDETPIEDYIGIEWMRKALYYSVVPNLAALILDMNHIITAPYIPQSFYDEIQGIVDGSRGKVKYAHLRRINFVSEITRAHCTILGAWGDATADGKLYHLRTLDWNPTALVNEFPSLIIYEPSTPGQQTYANVAWLGMVGTLTGMSKIGISIGEKVYYQKDGVQYGKEPRWSYFGKPWQLVLKDVLLHAGDMHDVERLLTDTYRTAMIHLGVGSSVDNTFRGVDYSSNDLIFYDDTNYTHYSTDYHPQYDGIFYYDRHVQPSGSTCLKSIIDANYGSITPEMLYKTVGGYHKTGDATIVVMDPAGQKMWIGFSQYMTTVNAYTRSPLYVDLTQFWGA
ncbi:hypothetical protein FGO68_gene6550 [Halteria grandinella]|uniref:Uncharacterized protein n=1 Tax=Halteria grandinella TaxID=5974 RepID=A0A8J8NP92_HALGN|nr:hypothetical protein FGO68_gene6550 [Halteria grandinella]